MNEAPIGVWHCPGCGTTHYRIVPILGVLKFPVIKCTRCLKMFYDPADAEKENKKWQTALNKKNTVILPMDQKD